MIDFDALDDDARDAAQDAAMTTRTIAVPETAGARERRMARAKSNRSDREAGRQLWAAHVARTPRRLDAQTERDRIIRDAD